MRVLFISNVSVWGGSVKSLYETMHSLKTDANIKSVLIIPAGDAYHRFESISDVFLVKAIPIIDNTLAGHYRGTRWFLLLREIIYFLFFLPGILKFRNRYNYFDIIHYNEIVCFASTLKLLKYFYPKAKFVTHVRSLQREESSLITNMVNGILKRANHIFCIDQVVAKTLPKEVCNKVSVLHNIASSKEIIINLSENKVNRPFNLLFLGGVNYSKGADFIPEIASVLKEYGVQFSLNVVGVQEEYTNRTQFYFDKLLHWLKIRKTYTLSKLKKEIEVKKLNGVIRLFPFTTDMTKYFTDADILIFPSRLNAPGRPSIEAMAFGVPSIIFCDFPDNDVVVEGFTGINVKSLNVAQFAFEILKLYKNQNLLRQLKLNCLNYHRDSFGVNSHVESLLKTYQSLKSIS